jgi:ATP-dependent DNA helicase RecG
MVQGNGYPVRVADTVQRMPADKIAAWKQAGFAGSWEARASEVTVDRLDEGLLRKALDGASLANVDARGYLLRRKLADLRGDRLVLRRAAELLFAREPHYVEHPNAGVRVFRVVGTERQTGAAHNVEELARQEGALPVVLAGTFDLIEPLLRKPSRLRGLHFEPTPEYPTFAWQEAIVNAMAHRDYAVTGRSVEVWLFDDRMEVTSPGGLLAAISLDALRTAMRLHASRNPRIVRALVDLGFMRDQGEGIPRMFGEMETSFLPQPILDATANEFSVVLRNTPVITPETSKWLASLANEQLEPSQIRALVLARNRGQVSNSVLRGATGLDTLAASNVLRVLRDRQLLESKGAGSSTFYVLGPKVPEELRQNADRGGLEADRGGFNADRGGLEADKGGLRDQLPQPVRDIVDGLGPRPRKQKLRRAILALCAVRPWKPSDLAELLGLRDVGKLVERHLGPMTNEGELRRTHPKVPAHPEQAYFSRTGS